MKIYLATKILAMIQVPSVVLHGLLILKRLNEWIGMKPIDVSFSTIALEGIWRSQKNAGIALPYLNEFQQLQPSSWHRQSPE